MRSNWQVWDFVRGNPQLVDIEKPGCSAIYAFDPYIEKILLDLLPKNLVGEFHVSVGPEITPDWLQDNLNALTLFGAAESRLILLAEDIPQKSWELLREMSAGLDQFYLLLSFSKNSPLFDDLGKSEYWTCQKIEAPKFWEQGKLLGFICNCLNVRLSYEVQTYILEKVEPTPAKYIGCLKNLILQGGNSKELSDVTLLASVLDTEHFDKFKLAKLYGQKKFIDCFQAIIEADAPFSVLEDFFSFMFNYLASLADTTLIDKKSYKSKYDKELLAFSRLWKEEEICHSIKQFRELLTASKSRDPFLKERIKQCYLGQF